MALWRNPPTGEARLKIFERIASLEFEVALHNTTSWTPKKNSQNYSDWTAVKSIAQEALKYKEQQKIKNYPVDSFAFYKTMSLVFLGKTKKNGATFLKLNTEKFSDMARYFKSVMSQDTKASCPVTSD